MKKAIFTYPDYGTPDGYPELTKRSGQTVEVFDMPVEEYDIEETGTMYNIKFDDGYMSSCFEDELEFINR